MEVILRCVRFKKSQFRSESRVEKKQPLIPVHKDKGERVPETPGVVGICIGATVSSFLPCA